VSDGGVPVLDGVREVQKVLIAFKDPHDGFIFYLFFVAPAVLFHELVQFSDELPHSAVKLVLDYIFGPVISDYLLVFHEVGD
jgi:hypothetical protein